MFRIDKLVEAEGTGSGLVLLSDVAALHRDQFDATKEPSSNEERDDIDPLITSTISVWSDLHLHTVISCYMTMDRP